MKLSPKVTEHPMVLECDYAPDWGAADYKYDVLLKEGFVFSCGRNAGYTSGLYRTVADFLHASPMSKQEYDELQ